MSALEPSLPRTRAARAAAAGYVVCAAVDTALAGSVRPDVRRWRRVTKPLLMPLLGTAFSASLAGRDLHGGGLLRGGTVAAQALSGAGDIALLSRRDPAFLVGLASFLAAHVAYTTAFVDARPAGQRFEDIPRRPGVRLAAAALLGLGPTSSWAAGRRRPALRAPVAAYATALTTMAASSTLVDPRLPAAARRRLVAGSLLFLASDALLAARTFVLREPPAWTDAAVMATYTAGQGLLAAGVSEAVTAREHTAHPTGTAIS